MRCSGRIILAFLGLALTLPGSRPCLALEAARESVTGGLLAVPAPGPAEPVPEATPAPAADSAPPADTAAPLPSVAPVADKSWGVLARGGYFGFPDVIANSLFHQHPKVTGATYGGEIRYHGDGGARGIASIGIAVDSCKAEGNGIWQENESDSPVAAGGSISLIAVTVTGYWNLMPSWVVHPYVGLGIGAGYFKGYYREDNDRVDVTAVLPVLHVPLGLAVELGDSLALAAEGRVLDGLAVGCSLQLRF